MSPGHLVSKPILHEQHNAAGVGGVFSGILLVSSLFFIAVERSPMSSSLPCRAPAGWPPSSPSLSSSPPPSPPSSRKPAGDARMLCRSSNHGSPAVTPRSQAATASCRERPSERASATLMSFLSWFAREAVWSVSMATAMSSFLSSWMRWHSFCACSNAALPTSC